MKTIWKGKYSYESKYDDLKSFPFELNIFVESEKFEGFAFEEEFTKLTGDCASVNGFIENDFISFTKQYPYFFGVDENGLSIFDKSKQGHQVVYEGNFNAEIAEWEGVWEIIVGEIRISGDEFEEEINFGTWRMKTE